VVGAEHQQVGGQLQGQRDDLGLDQNLTGVSLVHREGHRSGGKKCVCIAL